MTSAQATRLLSGWGLKFFDYDNDGAVDLILANGHPDDMIENYSPAVKYREPLLLFHQEGGKLRNVSAEAGPVFSKSYSARGLAVGDFDNDGRLDVLIGVNGGAPLLLKQSCRRGKPLAGTEARRRDVQPRRHRREDPLVRGRRGAIAAEEQRRQLSVVARSARGIGHRGRAEDRLGRDHMAEAQREGAAHRESTGRSVHPGQRSVGR